MPGEDIRVGLGLSAAGEEEREYTTKFGENVFYGEDAVRSPRTEFIQLFSEAIQGNNWFGAEDLRTPLGRKRQLVQAVFNNIEPHGQNWEIFNDIEAAYGGCGQPPDIAAARIQGILDGTFVPGPDWCTDYLTTLNSSDEQY